MPPSSTLSRTSDRAVSAALALIGTEKSQDPANGSYFFSLITAKLSYFTKFQGMSKLAFVSLILPEETDLTAQFGENQKMKEPAFLN
ncbi:hypothetical protein [Solidesulfovibrio fructosivorans]|uniref:hypothetical protein n=1 Tax=Solidesulfovibrio fructosivorans TaxID=878 RepID=UPI00117C53A6|nr:hypothetical protein [Solidesulfovibrio fructosivorans]